MTMKTQTSDCFPANETLSGGAEYQQQPRQQRETPDQEAAIRFFRGMLTLGRLPHRDIQNAIASAVVPLGVAATMCGIVARDLWEKYVRLGILRMYNGDVSETDFMKVTHLLQDVIGFFCEQERIRRNCSQSYQEIIKQIIACEAKSDDAVKQAVSRLSFYFNLSQSKAIIFESMTVILSQYFEFYPIGGSQGLQINVNNRNSINNEINIEINNDFRELARAVKDMAQPMSRAQAVNAAASPHETEQEAAGGHEERANAERNAGAWTAEANRRSGFERNACFLAAAKWRGLDHIAAYNTIKSDPVSTGSKSAYVTKARRVAEQIARNAPRLVMPPWRIKTSHS